MSTLARLEAAALVAQDANTDLAITGAAFEDRETELWEAMEAHAAAPETERLAALLEQARVEERQSVMDIIDDWVDNDLVTYLMKHHDYPRPTSWGPLESEASDG